MALATLFRHNVIRSANPSKVDVTIFSHHPDTAAAKIYDRTECIKGQIKRACLVLAGDRSDEEQTPPRLDGRGAGE